MAQFTMVQLIFALAIAFVLPLPVEAQLNTPDSPPPSFGSISTPRPIDPATGTTNPSARATQTLNPYLGSTPNGHIVDEQIQLSLNDAVARGLQFNLGLIDGQQADAGTTAQREHAFAELLPQITARAEDTYQQRSYKELDIKLPPQLGISLPPTSGGFGYAEARIVAQSPLFNLQLLNRYKELRASEVASKLSTEDARDVVVLAVGTAYFQVVASQARLETAKAAEASAKELNRQVADQYNSEVSPEIDALRASVELGTATQRVKTAANDLEKDKLTLDRIAGIPLGQDWIPAHAYDYSPLSEQAAEQSPTSRTRSDLASAQQEIVAAEFALNAARSQRLPQVSFEANYGGGGVNPGNFNQVYTVGGSVTVPIFTSGRIRSDVHAAEASLVQHRAAYRDLEGRVDYDIKIARLDLQSSVSAVQTAAANRALAERALTQSQDRFKNEVTNYLEVLQAQQALVTANENYTASLFSFNVAKIAMARALGSAESRLATYFGAQ